MDYYVNITLFKQEVVETDFVLCQGDYGNKLYIGGISDSRSAKIVFKKADGKTVERTNLAKSGNYYVYTLQPEELQVIGKVIADVKFTDATSRESSQVFMFTVKADTINNSVKTSVAYSDSIVAAKTEFNALITDMTTEVKNNTAQKIIYANTDLQTYCDGITSRATTAAQACEDIVANKVGISSTASDATAYSGKTTQAKIDAVQTQVTANATSTTNAINTTNNNLTGVTNKMGSASFEYIQLGANTSATFTLNSSENAVVIMFRAGEGTMFCVDKWGGVVQLASLNRSITVTVDSTTGDKTVTMTSTESNATVCLVIKFGN